MGGSVKIMSVEREAPTNDWTESGHENKTNRKVVMETNELSVGLESFICVHVAGR